MKTSQLVLGAPPECPQRPFCAPGMQRVYNATFKDFKPLDSGGPQTVAALDAGQIDVGGRRGYESHERIIGNVGGAPCTIHRSAVEPSRLSGVQETCSSDMWPWALLRSARRRGLRLARSWPRRSRRTSSGLFSCWPLSLHRPTFTQWPYTNGGSVKMFEKHQLKYMNILRDLNVRMQKML